VEDAARFFPDAAGVLKHGLRELEGREWQLLYLGGDQGQEFKKVPACEWLAIPAAIGHTRALAYHHTVYDAILGAMPDTALYVALWPRTHHTIGTRRV